MRARSVGVDRGWLGAQVFNGASAFNANIGAWNTAAVTTLSYVCAAFSARAARHHGRDALGGVFDAARAVARVCAQTCGHAHARASACAGIAARSKDGLYVCVYMYVYICMYIYILNMYRYMCTVGAIARADDAAVAIACARGYVRRYM
jgi:surface protein